MRRAIIVTLLLANCLAIAARAGLTISRPQDKGATTQRIYRLEGVGSDLAVLKVNDQLIPFAADGKFSCGLVLRPGKNYLEVRALDRRNRNFVRTIRLLYLKTYPDIEALYDGQKHWAREQIINLSSLGFIEGQPDGNFHPGDPITRGEIATWLARIKNLNISALTEDVFFDVPKEHWRAPYVKAVVKAGYMAGYDQQTFGVDDPISRRHAAVLVTLAEGIDVVERIRPLFIDVPKAERGAFPIYIAKEKGLVKGVSADLPVFEPDRALTRAEAAILLSRFRRSQLAFKYLYNFAQGFSPAAYCGLNLAPRITSLTVEPLTVRVNERQTLRLRAQLAPRDNFLPLAKVTVDLVELGGAPDVELYDDATHGDEAKGDLIYSLNLALEPKESGARRITVTATDQLGWQDTQSVEIMIVQ